MEKILNFYNEDGTLKTKEEVNSMVNNLYDELNSASTLEGNDVVTYLDTLITPDYQFSPENAKNNNDFLQRNLYLSSTIYSNATKDDLLGEINTHNIAQEIMEQIIMYNQIDDADNIAIDDRQPIRLFINTDGGEIAEAFELIDIIEMSKTPIITIGTGKVYSAGLLIFLSGTHRLAFPRSSYLLHEGTAIYGGDAQKFDSWADFYKNKIREQMKEYVISKTNITEAQYDSMRKDDVWFTAKEAINRNIATRFFKKEDM